MAIVIVQHKLNRQNGSVNTSVTMDNPIVTGNLLLALGFHYWCTGDSLTITNPADVYTQHQLDNALNMAGQASSKVAGVSESTSITQTKGGSANRGGSLGFIELSGASQYAFGGKIRVTSASSCTVVANGTPLENGSLAIAAFGRASGAQSPITPNYSAGWNELGKMQVNGAAVEIYVAYKTVNIADVNPACQISNFPVAADMAGVMIIITPDTFVAPVVDDPGTIHTGIGFPKAITPNITDVANNIASITLEGTSGKGIWTVTAQGSATVTGNGSHNVLIEGTHADVMATYATATYTPSVQGTDSAVTITAENGSALSASVTFSVIAHRILLRSANQADLNTVYGALVWKRSTPGVVNATITAIDTENLSDSVNMAITVVDPGIPVITVPVAQSMESDQLLPLGTIAVADSLNDLNMCRLTCLQGILMVTLSGAATISSGNNGSNDLTIAGTQNDILNTLVTLLYQSAPGFSGQDAVTILVTDALGGTDTDAIVIAIQAAAPPPVHVVPGSQNIFSGIQTAISGISVADPSGQLSSTSVSVQHGVLHVSLAGGATISLGQNDSNALTLTGSQTAINAALSSLIYLSDDYVGADSLVLQSVNVAGKVATSTIGLVVVIVPVSALPVVSIPAPVLVVSNEPKPLPGISVADLDDDLTSVTLTVVHGALSVTLQDGVSVIAGSNQSVSCQLGGTASALNTVLASLVYISDTDFIGIETLEILAQDAIGFSSSKLLAIIVNPPPGTEPISAGTQDLLHRLRANLGRVYGDVI